VARPAWCAPAGGIGETLQGCGRIPGCLRESPAEISQNTGLFERVSSEDSDFLGELFNFLGKKNFFLRKKIEFPGRKFNFPGELIKTNLAIWAVFRRVY
jgi:hypothetical protein